jgi:hypothetical protein
VELAAVSLGMMSISCTTNHIYWKTAVEMVKSSLLQARGTKLSTTNHNLSHRSSCPKLFLQLTTIFPTEIHVRN